MAGPGELRPTGVIGRGDLSSLFDGLSRRGFRLLGPTLRDRAIVYDDVASPDDLPIGWRDRQEAASYRLERREDAVYFGTTLAPQSWRRFLHPPTLKLWEAQRTGRAFVVSTSPPETSPRWAFIGVRPCDLAAIGVHDRVFVGRPETDVHYQARRASSFIVAVNCGEAGGTCFCTSMGTGPRARAGFDLALTEIVAGDRHELLLESGSSAGAELLHELPRRPARAEDFAAADAISAHAAASMGRTLDTTDVKDLLQHNPMHPRWANVAERCLACTNCTMVCPTCFCSTTLDTTDLTGTRTERWRRWDSCYTLDFSRLHGGPARSEIISLYRHWLTHKLASWFDQFGVSGCVGCGRCITWCPAGIDLTEEVRAIRASDGRVTETLHARP